MNKSKILIFLVIVALLVLAFIFISNKNSTSSPWGADPLNTTYVFEGQSVKLVEGVSEVSVPDSSSEIVTRAFGKPTYGDLDGDGTKDSVMFLTQSGGGTGEFYYAVVALNKNSLYEGLEGVLLGDRIAPQTIQIKDGIAIVNYADRKTGEPMTTQPSMGVSKYLSLDNGILKETSSFSQGDQVFFGELVMGEGARSFTPCGGEARWVIGSSTAYKKLTESFANWIKGNTDPYAPLYAVLVGKIVDAPKDGFGADYNYGIEVKELIKVSAGGKCL